MRPLEDRLQASASNTEWRLYSGFTTCKANHKNCVNTLDVDFEQKRTEMADTSSCRTSWWLTLAAARSAPVVDKISSRSGVTARLPPSLPLAMHSRTSCNLDGKCVLKNGSQPNGMSEKVADRAAQRTSSATTSEALSASNMGS